MALTDEQKAKLRKAAELDSAAAAQVKVEDDQPNALVRGWNYGVDKLNQFAADTANVATLGMGEGLIGALGPAPSEQNRAMVQGLQEGLMFGAPASYERLTGAAGATIADKLTGDGKMSYQDFLAKRDEDRAALREENPWSHGIGTVAGALVPVPGEGPLNVARQTAGALKRYGTAAGIGAGGALSSDLSSGRVEGLGDAARSATAGAMGGLVGQTLADFIPAVTRFAKENLSKGGAKAQARRIVGESMQGGPIGETSLSNVLNEGQGVTPELTNKMLAGMGEDGQRMLAESTPEARGLLADLMQSADTVGMTKNAATIADQRIKGAPRQIRDLVSEGMAPQNRPAMPDLLSMNAAQRRQASETYKEIFDGVAGSTEPVITKHTLLSGIVDDPMNDSPDIRKTYDAVRSLIKNTGEGNELTMKGLQNIKLNLDDKIKDNFRGLSSAEKLSQRALLDMRDMVKGTMEEFGDDSFKQAAKIYGTTLKQDEAIDFGASAIRATNTKLPADELQRFIGGLSESEKIGVQEGALGWMLGQAQDNPSFFRKLAAENPDKLMRLSSIFGDTTKKSPEEIAEGLQSILESLGDFQRMKQGRARAGRHAVEQAGEQNLGLLNMARALFVGGKVASGDIGHGATFTQTARLLGRRNPEINRTLMDLLQETDQSKAATTIQGLRRAAERFPITMPAARAGGALVNSIMNQAR